MRFKHIGRTGITVILAGGLVFSHCAAADGVSRGALLASMCATCHGTDGAGSGSIPRISGNDVADFVDMMKAFAGGDEPATVMDRHAKGYTDEEIRALAEYFGKR